MVHLVHEPRPKAMFAKTVAGKLKVTKEKGGALSLCVRTSVRSCEITRILHSPPKYQ